MGKILIIEDDGTLRNQLQGWVKAKGYKEISPKNLSNWQELLLTPDQTFDIFILEASLSSDCPINQGLKFMRPDKLKKQSVFMEFILPVLAKQMRPTLQIIIVAKSGSSTEASFVINNGALDYIQIPSDPELIKDRLLKRIEQGFALINEKKVIAASLKSLSEIIIGKSEAIQSCLREVLLFAKNDSPVLITGETGTGKELLAQALHENGIRKNKRLIAVNCAAITETIANAELFGIKGGTVSGVPQDTIGKIKSADGGTLFLDEIGELPITTQARLLRALQEKNFYQVNGTIEIKSDFRLISATNQDLQQMVQKRLFREDLLYRINKLTITSPPLRERISDIELLIKHYMKENMGYEKDLDPEFIEALKEYTWPGNIRELFNVVGKAAIKAGADKKLQDYHLPISIRNEWIKKTYDKEGKDTFWALSRKGITLTMDDLMFLKLPKPKKVMDVVRNKNNKNLFEIFKYPDESGTESQETKPPKNDTINKYLNLDFKLANNFPTLNDYEATIKKYYLKRLMEITNENANEAVEICGVKEPTLYYHLKKYGIPTKNKRTKRKTA